MSDKQMSKLVSEKLIDPVPVCVGIDSSKTVMNIEIGNTKEKCFIRCLDRYISYSVAGETLAYKEVKNLSYLKGIDFSVGHIKNMVIAANINKYKGDVDWTYRLKKACKDDKSLRGFCG